MGAFRPDRKSGRLLLLGLVLGIFPVAGVGSGLASLGGALGPGAVVSCSDTHAGTGEGVPVVVDVLSSCQSLAGGDQVQSVTQPSDGRSSINPNGTVTYAPGPGFTGQDSFTFTASDATGLFTSTANVYVTVAQASTTTTSSSTSSSTTTATSTASSSSTASELTVGTTLNGGGPLTGFYAVLSHDGATVATGYTPVSFKVDDGQAYAVEVEGYGGYYFQYWANTGSVDPSMTLTAGGDLSVTAVMCDGPPGTCPDATPVDGISVYAHRIPASYWAPCFATSCSAGKGPGASMFFQLYDSSGNLLQSAYADEGGYTFTGLTPGATYYVLADNCDLCHGSVHDVVFRYWGNDSSTANPMAASVGADLDAWFSCTNECA